MTQTVLIATHHWMPNFGANLQAFATSTNLKRMKYNPIFLNFRPKELIKKYKKTVPENQHFQHDLFVQSHMNQTDLISTYNEYLEIVDHLKPTYMLTGSDAVFRLNHSSSRSDLDFPNPYWLASNQHISTRIALAPSTMGCNYSELSSQVLQKISHCLNDFKSVSARDLWTIQQLRKTGFNKEITLLPDPVFSLFQSKKDIIDNFEGDKDQLSRTIIISSAGYLSSNSLKKFTQLANSNGLLTASLPTPEGRYDMNVNYRIEFPISPFDWFSSIILSFGYVGTRFHPIVVSLLGGKPFISLDLYHSNYFKRKMSKTWLLLKQLKLQRYCIPSKSIPLLSADYLFKKLTSSSALDSQLKIEASAKYSDLHLSYLKRSFK